MEGAPSTISVVEAGKKDVTCAMGISSQAVFFPDQRESKKAANLVERANTFNTQCAHAPPNQRST